MIEPRQALYAHLRADPRVQAAVGDRIHQRSVPADSQKPLLLIWPPPDDVPVYDLAGIARWRSRIQVTAMGTTQPQVEKAARAVVAAVSGFRGMMAGVLPVVSVHIALSAQIDQHPVDEIHQHVDVIIEYKEAS